MRTDRHTARRPAVAVLTDDLTSAGDGAAPFLNAGYPARIQLESWGRAPPGGGGGGDLDSRRLPERSAAQRMERAARDVPAGDVLLKTVDSTLRGHVAAEIRAVLAGSRRTTAVIAPAFPAEGRTTAHGVQMVGGVPVHATEFGQDPAHPVRCSDLAALLPDAVLIEPADVSRLPDLIGRVPLLVCSARTDDTLALLAGHDIGYLPFPGVPEGHPTVLRGTAARVADDCRRYEQAGCAGVDLLAYRAADADPLDLVRAARAATTGRLVVAGGIESPARLHALAHAGADAFTIGSAAFSGAFEPRLGTLHGQLDSIFTALADMKEPQAR